MTFEIEGQILKITLPQKNGHRIKMPKSKLMSLVSSCWEKNCIRKNAQNFFNLSLLFLKLLIGSVAFVLGHPVLIPRILHGFTFKTTLSMSWLQQVPLINLQCLVCCNFAILQVRRGSNDIICKCDFCFVLVSAFCLFLLANRTQTHICMQQSAPIG